ncbi:MAG: thioredoxin [Flavobacteriaceae bacterium]|nr:thioredoxin [Bacteroidia bacterium]NNF74668.1 thioredoxin [Flavobacteriaceae bacterium]NNK72083.1 thioredoxin [Flavobacteriaceae bacterium]
MASFKDIINKKNPVLIDFYAEWCGPCKLMSPVLKAVKEELGESVNVIKIDVDKNRSIAGRFKIRGVPTFLIFKNGKQTWRQSGIISKEELISKLKLTHV